MVETKRHPLPPRVAAYLRKCKGLSPVLIAKRQLRALDDYLESVMAEDPYEGPYPAAGGADGSYYDDPAMTPREIVSLQLVGHVARERLQALEREGQNPSEAGAVSRLVSVAAMATREALEQVGDGHEPEGLKRRYKDDEELPPYVVVWGTLLCISETGRM